MQPKKIDKLKMHDKKGTLVESVEITKVCSFRNNLNSLCTAALELKGVIKFVSGGKNALSGCDKRRTHARQFKTDPCQYKIT